MKKMIGVAAAAAMSLSATAAVAEKWDMPMAYAATNFHSEMGVFADKVRDYTGGKIDICVMPADRFSRAARSSAVQTDQADRRALHVDTCQRGPLLGWDNLPFYHHLRGQQQARAAAEDKVNAQLDSLNHALHPWHGQASTSSLSARRPTRGA